MRTERNDQRTGQGEYVRKRRRNTMPLGIQNKNKKNKSVDAGGDSVTAPELTDSSDWEYSELLSFLPDEPTEKRTFRSVALGLPNDETESSCSSYAYPRCSPPQNPQKDSPSASQLNIDDNIHHNIAKGIVYLINDCNLRNKQKTSSLKYIEYLLSQLPDEKATLLSFDIIQNLQKEVLVEIEKQK